MPMVVRRPGWRQGWTVPISAMSNGNANLFLSAVALMHRVSTSQCVSRANKQDGLHARFSSPSQTCLASVAHARLHAQDYDADVTDLFKDAVVIPLAFEMGSDSATGPIISERVDGPMP